MNIFYDTEFIDKGRKGLDLISIGMINESGDTLYHVSNEFSYGEIVASESGDWLKKNVLRKLPPRNEWIGLGEIAARVTHFCGEKPTFWGYYPAYDHVLLYSLFGRMMDAPKGWPMKTNCIKQLQQHLGIATLPKQEIEHDALEDAKWNMECFDWLTRMDKYRIVSDFNSYEKRVG